MFLYLILRKLFIHIYIYIYVCVCPYVDVVFLGPYKNQLDIRARVLGFLVLARGAADRRHPPGSAEGECCRVVHLPLDEHMGGCQNYGLFLGLRIIRHLVSRGPKRGP